MQARSGLHDYLARKYTELYTSRICCITVEPVTRLYLKVIYGYARKLVGSTLQSTTKDKLL